MEANIFQSTDICMEGKELRRLRDAAGLSQRGLARKMVAWNWSRDKVKDFEEKHRFCLDKQEMNELLLILGAERKLG